MRAVIYARYSSDLQSTASIDDQIRLCRERVERENGTVVDLYADYAISGSSLRNRPSMQALLNQARNGKFDCVFAEALDRISRDQEDIAAIYKRLGHSGIRLFTLAEGEITELHVGLKGTMNALYLKDLAHKTRRGLRGRVESGRSGGGLCYGYDVVHETAPDGTAVPGRRRINETEAEVVRQIFVSFASGHSPRRIALDLNRARIRAPGGLAGVPRPSTATPSVAPISSIMNSTSADWSGIDSGT
jgi:site-specific DNA recombinase